MSADARLADDSGMSREQLAALFRQCADAGERAHLSTERLAATIRHAAGQNQ